MAGRTVGLGGEVPREGVPKGIDIELRNSRVRLGSNSRRAGPRLEAYSSLATHRSILVTRMRRLLYSVFIAERDFSKLVRPLTIDRSISGSIGKVGGVSEEEELGSGDVELTESRPREACTESLREEPV